MEDQTIYENPCFLVSEQPLNDSLNEGQSNKNDGDETKAAYYLTLIEEPAETSQSAPVRSQSKSQPQKRQQSQQRKENPKKKDEQLTYYEITPEPVKVSPVRSQSRSRPAASTTRTEPNDYLKLTRNVNRDRNILLAVLFIAALSIFIALVALVVSLWSAFSPPSSASPSPSTSNGGMPQANQTTNQPAVGCPDISCSTPDPMLASRLDALNQQLSSLDLQVNQRIDTLDLQLNQQFLTLDQLNQRFVTSDQLNQMFITTTQFQEFTNNVSALEMSIRNISNSIQLRFATSCSASVRQVPDCGPGDWLRVAYIDMTDPSQQCPSAWRLYSSQRSCVRPVTSSGSCPSTSFGTCGLSYNRVCGKIIGYQFGSPDCFSNADVPNHPTITSLNDIYVDGVSVTHGRPTRSHIWTFALGHSPNSNDRSACPCDNANAYSSPSFIGNNYFCESGATGVATSPGQFYAHNKVWDGAGCVGGSCCSFNSPPWFSVQLPSSTTDDIDVRICGDEGTDNEDAAIELVEIYVQ